MPSPFRPRRVAPILAAALSAIALSSCAQSAAPDPDGTLVHELLSLSTGLVPTTAHVVQTQQRGPRSDQCENGAKGYGPATVLVLFTDPVDVQTASRGVRGVLAADGWVRQSTGGVDAGWIKTVNGTVVTARLSNSAVTKSTSKGWVLLTTPSPIDPLPCQ